MGDRGVAIVRICEAVANHNTPSRTSRSRRHRRPRGAETLQEGHSGDEPPAGRTPDAQVDGGGDFRKKITPEVAGRRAALPVGNSESIGDGGQDLIDSDETLFPRRFWWRRTFYFSGGEQVLLSMREGRAFARKLPTAARPRRQQPLGRRYRFFQTGAHRSLDDVGVGS